MAAPHWAVEVWSAAGIRRGSVPARSINLDFPLDNPVTGTVTINGRDPVAAQYVEELTHDLVFFRNGVKMMRGRICGEPTHELDANGHTMTVPVVDYRGLLDRRIIWPTSTLAYTNVEQAAIAWDLIRDSQALTGGNWGISQGIGTFTGIQRDRNYPAGKKIGEAIGDLGRAINGFEWEVDADLAFNVYYPQRGSERSFKLHWGTNISHLTRGTSTQDYTNALRYSGDDSITPVTRVAADLATRPEGRWETSLGDPDITLPNTLDERADGELADKETLLPSYTVVLRRGRWPGRGELWLGDQCRLELKSGGLDVGTDIRVMNVGFGVGKDNDETVTLTLGRPARTWLEFWRGSMRRLDRLENR